MLLSSFSENFSIYFDNLSGYLVATLCITAFCVFLTICLQLRIPIIDIFEKMIFSITNRTGITSRSKNLCSAATDVSNVIESNEANPLHKAMANESKESSTNSEVSPEFACGDDELSISRFKTIQQNEILNKLQRKMTQQQQDEEEQLVNEQLARIFTLLKEQEEKFMVTDMDDLKEQLSLYK